MRQVEGAVELREIAALVGAAALLASERAAGDPARERERLVLREARQTRGVADQPGALPQRGARRSGRNRIRPVERRIAGIARRSRRCCRSERRAAAEDEAFGE